MVRESHMHITGFQPHASQCSFYDEAGIVDAQQLQSLLPAQHDPVVGWFSSRHAHPLRPSMRESAVTFNLAHHLGPQQPVLFLALSHSQTHAGATQSTDYRYVVAALVV